MRDKRERREGRHTRADLSRDDLLFLLSILEGELQARDEVIAVLKSEKTDSALLGAQYGFSGPEKVLRALQRDSLRAQQCHLDDVYKKPTAELDHMVETWKHSSKGMMEQLLEVSRSHRCALERLEKQEKSHRDFVHRSNCLTTLLEQDRERLKLLIAKEIEYQEIKEKKCKRKVSRLTDELTNLKVFARIVAQEQQCLSELLEEQRHQLKELTDITDNIKQEAGAAYPCAKKEELKLHLEVERDNQVSILNHSQKIMTAPSLLSEVEILRRRVVEMEGKDEDLLRMWDQCRDFDRRLAQETSHCRSLRVEVDKLNGRISDLDRIEEILGKSKQECSIMKSSMEQEREASKSLSGELDNLKVRVKELQATEGQLGKRDAVIRQDLAKLRSLTVALVEDRKIMAERLRQAEEKLNRKEGTKNEQSDLATMTERLEDESQQTLRCKADLEERIHGIAKEKEELQDRLQTEEERNRELQNKVTIMRKRLQVLENRKEKEDKYTHNLIPNITNHHCQTEDNKVKELTQELDSLRKTLQDKEMLEGELIRIEEDFEFLDKKFKDEQKKSEDLTHELELAKRELSRYDQAEKQEVNQEHLLLCRLQKEQVKSRLLGREVDTLKEKLQKLMGTEESICRVQADHSVLQRKLTQQEARNRQLAKEIKELCSELERYRQIKILTPGASRDSFSDLDDHMSKEVQTEENGSLSPHYSKHSEKLAEEYEVEDQNHIAEITNRSSLVNRLNSLNSANNNMSQYSSHSDNGIDMRRTVNGEVMMVTHTPGQPLHIKVTPHHILNTATLEISSPTGDAATSYTSTAVIPTSGASPKQRITIIQNSAPSPGNTNPLSSNPDHSVSPPNKTPINRMLNSNSSRSVTPDHNNPPIQIVTVRTCSPDPTEVANQTVFCKTPERQNSCQHQKSNTTDTSPSIISKEDNKIHIHLGSPYIRSLNGVTHSMSEPVGPYYLRHEQRTQVLSNGCHVKGVGKITSSITISPDSSSASHLSNITVSGLCD